MQPANRTISLSDERHTLSAYLGASAVLSAAAVTGVSGATVVNFQDPYEIPANQTLNTELALTGAIGDWTGSFSGGGTATSSLTSENSTPVTNFTFTMALTGNADTRTYDFVTTSAGSGNVDFTVSDVISSSGSVALFLINGTSQGNVLSNGNKQFAVTAGQTFGFRFSITYLGFGENLTAKFSNFVAPVPEPASTATWMGAGVLGMVAIREFRRRRKASTAEPSNR